MIIKAVFYRLTTLPAAQIVFTADQSASILNAALGIFSIRLACIIHTAASWLCPCFPASIADSIRRTPATMQTQASMMGFNGGFLLLGIFFVAVSPAILLLRPRKSGAEGGR